MTTRVSGPELHPQQTAISLPLAPKTRPPPSRKEHPGAMIADSRALHRSRVKRSGQDLVNSLANNTCFESRTGGHTQLTQCHSDSPYLDETCGERTRSHVTAEQDNTVVQAAPRAKRQGWVGSVGVAEVDQPREVSREGVHETMLFAGVGVQRRQSQL